MNSLDQLAAILDEKRSILEELKLLLKHEQVQISDLNLPSLEGTGQDKERIILQLHVLNNLCREHLSAASSDLQLPTDSSLSPVIEKAKSPERERLKELQSVVTVVAHEVTSLNELNRELLQDSLRVTNRSIEFFNKILGVTETYGHRGEVVEERGGARLLRKEI
jgi:flagellar biosynthesis/type III secretory pathway chaperone